jgi:hypothetical protein
VVCGPTGRLNVDVDAKGNPVGVEVLYAVRRLGHDALTNIGVDLSGGKQAIHREVGADRQAVCETCGS